MAEWVWRWLREKLDGVDLYAGRRRAELMCRQIEVMHALIEELRVKVETLEMARGASSLARIKDGAIGACAGLL